MKPSSLPIVGFVLTATPTLTNPVKNCSAAYNSTPATVPANSVSVASSSQQSQTTRQPRQSVWGIFTSTFLTIFLAEIGDKTQLTTLLMSAESQSPWIVFAGAGMALIGTSLLGVLIGRWMAQRLSPKTMETSAGTILLLISVMLLWDVVQMGG